MWKGGVLSGSTLSASWSEDIELRQSGNRMNQWFSVLAIKNRSATITELSQALIKMQIHLDFPLHCWVHPNKLPILGQTQLQFTDNVEKPCVNKPIRM